MQYAMQNQSNPVPHNEVQRLAEELKLLLAKHSDLLTEEGVRRHIEKLDTCVKAHCGDFDGDGHMSKLKYGLRLVDLRSRLKLSADERLRLEGEGGVPADKDQASGITKTCLKAWAISTRLSSTRRWTRSNQFFCKGVSLCLVRHYIICVVI